MKKSFINKNIYYLFGILLIIVIWTITSLLFDENELIFPDIFSVFKEFIIILDSSYTYKCLFYTLIRMIEGYGVSLVHAIIIGTISSISVRFRYIIKPYITVLKTIPTASLVFFFIVLSGARNAPLYIVMLICFPILYESMLAGYLNIDQTIDDVLLIEGGNSFIKIIKVRFPLALKELLIGISSSFGLAFKIEIMAEVISGSTSNGLGSMINYIQKTDPTNMKGIFAYSMLAVMIALIFDAIIKNVNKDSWVLKE